MAGSPPSVTSSFRRAGERPVVSGLGISSGSEASGGQGRLATAAAAGGSRHEGESRRRDAPWVQPPPSKKTLWRRHIGLEEDPSQQRRASTERHSPPRREVSPEMENKCFRCLLEGHFRKDCTNDIVCIRCGLSGHGSRDCKCPRSPSSAEDLRREAAAKAARRDSEQRGVPMAPRPDTARLPPPPPPLLEFRPQNRSHQTR